MKNPTQIVVYGSYGYTGKLIVRECLQKNLDVVLAGRNEEALMAQNRETGYPFHVVTIDQTEKLKNLLAPATLVIHCGGPFVYTAEKMAETCLATNTHYIDITGEIGVLELLAGLDERASQAGIMILPGAGFDVVPSDCLALHLKNRLPEVTHLELAFAMSDGGISRGTAKTTIEGLGEGSCIRQDGKLKIVPLHQGIKAIHFGKFSSLAARIPWGDLATAWRTTSIPNIEVFMGIDQKLAFFMRLTSNFNWLLKKRWLKNILLRQADRGAAGPADNKRGKARSYLVGRAWTADKEVKSEMVTLDGYTLTAKTCLLIAERILRGDYKAGYQTPASAYGSALILEVPETQITDR